MTANEERMRDVKTTALEVMLRSRIVATASSNFVYRKRGCGHEADQRSAFDPPNSAIVPHLLAREKTAALDPEIER